MTTRGGAERHTAGDQKMETIRLGTSEEELRVAAGIIQKGGLAAFPTETVYGLGGNALDESAVRKIYAVKGRPGDNPMIVHIARASDVGRLTPGLTPAAVSLIDHFWPGPLTLVLKKRTEVPEAVTGGLPTVAVRMPDHPAALELIRLSGCPIAAPSANLSGRPSPTKAEHVLEDLNGKIDAVIMGEDCRVGIESTVLDMTGDAPVILRPGVVTARDIEAAIGGEVKMDPALLANRPEAGRSSEYTEPGPKSPGMKYEHYAPKARMVVLEGRRDRVKSEIDRLKRQNEALGNKVGVILFEEKAFREAAHDFFAELRALDKQGADLILAGALSDTNGVGFAVMNRMLKAAGYHIVKV